MAKTASLDEETSKKVIRQVEFYFSDSNLPRDTFLKQTISENEDGMVSLALVCSFSRMRTHLGLGDATPEDISDDTVQAVAETLRTSSFLKVSEDGKKVGRVTKLAKPEEVIEQLDIRTIAASPLEYDVKLEDVESFFCQFGKVNSVRLPRHVNDKRLFCGTALIEFSSEEDAKKVLEQSLVYSGMDLQLKPKKDFDEERAKQEQTYKSRSQFGSNRKSNSPSEEDYPRGLIVAFKLKSISANDASENNGNNEQAAENIGVLKSEDVEDDQGNNDDVEGGEEKNEENDGEETGLEKTSTAQKNEEGPDSLEKPSTAQKNEDAPDSVEKSSTAQKNEELPDSVEKPSTAQKNEEAVEKPSTAQKNKKGSNEEKSTVSSYKDDKDIVLREDLKSVFGKFGTVKFVDFKMGEETGYIRFEDAGASQKARAAAVLSEEGGLIVKNFIATLDPVTGDAEKEYWSLLRNNQERNRGNFKGNRGRGGKNNRGWKHSRGRENDTHSRPNKFQKVGAS